MRKKPVWIFLLGLAIAGGMLSSCSRHDDTIVLKLAHVLDTGHSVHQGMVHKAERLEYYSNGRMRIDIYPSGQLGAERETVELVQIGSPGDDQGFRRPAGKFCPGHEGIQYSLRFP